MQKNRWSRKFDWVKSGTTYVQQDRSEKYNENRFISVGDIYFKLNKYLTGVTFTYINSLSDIYKRDLITGDGYSVVNMYNEYDVIDRVLKNIVFVDIASNTHIDLNKQWTKIDNVQLKPGHLVLLFNQNSEFENDIYKVTPQFFLKNAGLLAIKEKVDRFSCSIKMGTNAEKQFFLLPNGLDFPQNYEPKYFIEGKSFILKNLIKYNLYNTSTNSAITSKIIFTDYDFARKQLINNYDLYYKLYFTGTATPTNSYVTIDYHHDSYTIRTGTNLSFTGMTSGITNMYSGLTAVPYPGTFDVSVGDYIYLNIFSGSTSFLLLKTFIKSIETNYLILEETVPNRILTDLKKYNFSLENLNIASDWTNAIYKLSNHTPYIDFYTVSGATLGNIILKTLDCKYDKYFDYNDLTFNFIDDSVYKYFYTDNQYIKYNLYDRLNQINSTLFTSGFSFFNEYLLTGITYSYTDNNRIIIHTTLSGITDIFKPYTYVYISGLTEATERTLVYDVNDFEIVIEKPRLWTNYPPPEVTSIQNIDGLQAISNILYEVYINSTYDWYIQRTDNERKYIAKAYAELLTLNKNFRENVTGILFENENNEFVLKLYDLENDQNLYFSTIELVFVGSDRKTRLPVPLNMVQRTVTSDSAFDLYWNVLDGGFDDVLSTQDYFDFGLDLVLGGPNNPPLLFTVIDGN